METVTEPKVTKMGRGRVDIDWDFVDQKLEAHCSAESIASRLGIDRTTLYKRCEQDRGLTFSTLAQLKRQDGDDDLRDTQHRVAMSGDKVMLVWLGKNRLGQSDKKEIAHTDATSLAKEIAAIHLANGIDSETAWRWANVDSGLESEAIN